MINIQSILMSSSADFQIKKSCLEQLNLILFDVSSKRGRMLFKSEVSSGSKDLFNFLVWEINNTYNTVQGYMKSQVSFLDVSHQSYINECLKFIFYSAVIYPDEPEVKAFFGKLR